MSSRVSASNRSTPRNGRDHAIARPAWPLKPAAPEAPEYVQKLDKQGRAYATGKRKNAVARVWIKPGSGKIVVNTGRSKCSSRGRCCGC